MNTVASRVTIAESVWRKAAQAHQDRIFELLRPGLTTPTPMSSKKRNRDQWTPLDKQNPIYNFLIEYYGLKGTKGPRRLARWSPDPAVLNQASHNSNGNSIFLQGATADDLGSTLHMRGAMLDDDGVCYSPRQFFLGDTTETIDEDTKAAAAAAAKPYLWYRTLLHKTLQAEPVLHCHGLHEWAMQYQPDGAIPPPSAQYQQHLPLRVSQAVLNAAVERRGISCTHVDALRFFAPAAGPLNVYGTPPLPRAQQLQLEQPGCVHAQMDLLKIILRLQPFCRTELVADILHVALDARRLDVAASPYDARAYGLPPVPVETKAGRAWYRQQQSALMEAAQPVRQQLLEAYNVFLKVGFGDHIDLEDLDDNVDDDDERIRGLLGREENLKTTA